VTFPSSLREVASRALALGADAYLLEPFYAPELLRLATSLLQGKPAPASPAPPADPEPLRRLAREVAHAVNNPLQVARLLLEKKNVTKKEIEEGLPPQLERVDEVVSRLRTFGALEPGPPERAVAEEIAEEAAEAAGVPLEVTGRTPVRVDRALVRGALEALFGALFERSERVAGTMEEGVLRVALDEGAFEGEEPVKLRDAVFVVTANRELRSGLALPRLALAEHGGELTVEKKGASIVVCVRFPRA
jgi:hypothetical protein